MVEGDHSRIQQLEELARRRGQTVEEYLSPDLTQARWEDPETHRARFEELAGCFKQGSFTRRNPDGSRTEVVSYEGEFDSLDRLDMSLLREFRLRAAAAGLTEAFFPLTIPTQFQREGTRAGHTLSVIQLGYEKPASLPAPSTTRP